jgi:CRP-like cAMP-binding protein/CheY-like chemotaxis protein
MRTWEARGIEPWELAIASEEQKREFLKYCKLQFLKPGDVLFEEDKEWRTFYVVVSGRLRKRLKITAPVNATFPEKYTATGSLQLPAPKEDAGVVDDGDPKKKSKTMNASIGYIERGEAHGAAPIALKDTKADYGVEALQQTTVLSVDLETYNRIFKDVHAKAFNEWTAWLVGSNAFANATQLALSRLIPMMVLKRFKKGQHIVKCNDYLQNFFVLKEGECDFMMDRKDANPREVRLSEPIPSEDPRCALKLWQEHHVNKDASRLHVRDRLSKILSTDGLEPHGISAPLLKQEIPVRTIGPGGVVGEEVCIYEMDEYDQLHFKSTYSLRVRSSEAWVFCGDITCYRQLQSCLGFGGTNKAAVSDQTAARIDQRQQALTEIVNGSNHRVYETKRWRVKEKERIDKLDELRRMRVTEHPVSRLINRPVSNIILTGNLVVLAPEEFQRKEELGPPKPPEKHVDEISPIMQKVKLHFAGKRAGMTKSSSLPTITANPLGGTLSDQLNFPAPPTGWKQKTFTASDPDLRLGTTFVTEGLPVEEEPTLLEPQAGPAKMYASRPDARPFERLIAGRSFLCLSDDRELKKAVKRTFLGSSAGLTFVKSSMECLHAIIDPRSQYTCFFVDLTKPGLNADSVVRTVRENARHADAPIIVFADQQEDLSDFIRQTGSYVIFKPVVGRVMRDAVVWCLKAPRPSDQASDPTRPMTDASLGVSDGTTIHPASRPASNAATGTLIIEDQLAQ